MKQIEYEWRFWALVVILILLILGLIGRIIYLGIFEHDFLLGQSKLRSVRDVGTYVSRGIIKDRHGTPLAISVPAGSIWIDPKLFRPEAKELNLLSKFLEIDLKLIKSKWEKNIDREFVYLKRSVSMEIVKEIMSLGISGVFFEKGHKRHYPEGEAVAHVIGFTNIDDSGQEGIELAYDHWLRGIPGKTRVLKDRLGNTVTTLAVLAEPQKGNDLLLSIDHRIQYLAYNELKKAVLQRNAESGSAIVLSVKTGEILAMVNVPSYDPSNRKGISVSRMRNRAVTDLFEPGSTIKAFSIANALHSGKYKSTTVIDTNPGVFKVGGHVIYDNHHKNNGTLTVKEVLEKSSDIGTAKMTLSLPSNSLLNILKLVGFGKDTQSGFPGEASGFLPDRLEMRPFILATLSFGYGISVTLLQLAQAYSILAAGGIFRPVSFLKIDSPSGEVEVLPRQLCFEIINMLAAVVTRGTGSLAKIAGYKVAGKTGTSHIASPYGGYYSNRYFASFVGFAPVFDPELVVAVMVKDPKGAYFGSVVAAPIFANIMRGALRILGIKLDNIANRG